jgi:hypothetical protein
MSWTTRAVLGAGLALVAAAGTATAGQPTRADVDFCNKQAAHAAAMSPREKGDSSRPASGKKEEQKPKDGGSVTEGRQPGTFPFGMAPLGHEDVTYREVYEACLDQRSQ